MMATKVIMPQLGESVVEGTVTSWLKKEGETIAEYESLLVECGFGDVLFFPSLSGVEDARASDFMAIVAHKREG